MLRALHFARSLIADATTPGSVAIDATAGNGHDTEFLAKLVGADGRVYAFDIQEQAVVSTRERVRAAGMEARVQVVHAGHERMGEFIPGSEHGLVSACMFNLGYLPRGDKSITTQMRTSLAALQYAVELLALNGIITVMFYPGHPEGAEEVTHIGEWARTLPQTQYLVLRYEFINLSNFPPQLLVIQKNPVLGALHF